ncbi:DUF1232 domain-containing protein [Anaerocolumna sedimenticola]|uniref:DUF1232 domain-containing protein n=1 Tax=Anaerocolumna sedimenticola TaxID=2696063 RepID=A0A6P1TTN0_9FIRM|nr:DUF1232 domain-containing protein [Anaerocolumna sedimenticola]QHQ62858.1 DUF1232 domain-containing protein [Anaerocolumna sedimenticola]
MNLKEKVKEIKKNIVVLFIAVKKKETPWYAKILAGFTVIYALSPLDLVPDFIPVLGYLDDLIILPVLILLSIRMIPKHILEQAKQEAIDIWKDGKPDKWYYAIPIVCIWIAVVVLLIRIVSNIW